MGKSGVITYLFRVLNHCGRKHLTLVRTSLEALALHVVEGGVHDLERHLAPLALAPRAEDGAHSALAECTCTKWNRPEITSFHI